MDAAKTARQARRRLTESPADHGISSDGSETGDPRKHVKLVRRLVARSPCAAPKRRFSIGVHETSARSNCFSVTPNSRARRALSLLRCMIPSSLPNMLISEE